MEWDYVTIDLEKHYFMTEEIVWERVGTRIYALGIGRVLTLDSDVGTVHWAGQMPLISNKLCLPSQQIYPSSNRESLAM
jgi:hypothetical protein